MQSEVDYVPFEQQLRDEFGYLYRTSCDETADFQAQLSKDDLSVHEVLRAHFSIAEYFTDQGQGIGGVGVKDVGMLISALARQNAGYGNVQKWTTVHQKAATLLFGLVMNHPFYDANKRTAYLSTVYYLYRSGYILEVTEKQLEDLTVQVAEKQLKKYPRYRDLLKKSQDPEVEYLAYYFKKNSRLADRNQYLVTYRELDKLLQKYDAHLANPNNNMIDVMQWQEVEVRHGWLSKPKKTKELRRVFRLGFPGWNKQVKQGRLKHVRDQLKLSAKDGVDSQSFFNGLDDMKVLMQTYEGALTRLADR